MKSLSSLQTTGILLFKTPDQLIGLQLEGLELGNRSLKLVYCDWLTNRSLLRSNSKLDLVIMNKCRSQG